MANIPSHMRLQDDFVALRRAPRVSNSRLIALGVVIGLIVAASVLLLSGQFV